LAPGHIMLGLIAEGQCVATEALRVLDVDLDAVRQEMGREMEQGHAEGTIGRRAQTKETKEVIALAIAEARKFGHRYVGTEHLVLALLAHENNVAARVLRRQGVRMEELRDKMLAMLRSRVEPGHDLAHSRHGEFEWVHQQELAKAFRSVKFWRTMILAVDSANRLGSGEVEPQHLLLALLRDETTGVARLLAEKGVTAEWVRERFAAV
jgi:ATP-dependent Clp protease ATP-binding subunit ClpA